MKPLGMKHSTQTPSAILFRPYLSCLNAMLGTEWLIRLIYVVGSLCFVGALLFVESDTIRANVLLTSTIFVITPMVMYAPVKFRFFVSSARFALAPNGRSTALFSLIVCNLIAILCSGVAAYFIGENVAIVVTVSALAFSGISLYIQAAITGVKKLILSMVMLAVGLILIKRELLSFSTLEEPILLGFSLSAAVLLWVSAFVWLRLARNITPVSTMFTDPQNCNQDQAWLMNLWSANAEDMGKRALMHGMVDSLVRRFSLHAILLFGFPAGMLLMQVILASESARLVEKPMPLLFLSCYALMMAPMINGDWLTRTRLLWLRMAGDRSALLRFWVGSMLIDKAVSLFLLLSYVLALHLIFDLSLKLVLSFVLSYVALDMLIALTWSYLRICGLSLSNVTAVNFGTAMIIAVVLFTLGKFDLWLWFGVVIIAMMLCNLWVAALIRRRFSHMDWSAVKPLRFGKRG